MKKSMRSVLPAEQPAQIKPYLERIEQTWKTCRGQRRSTLSEPEQAFTVALKALFDSYQKEKDRPGADIQKSLKLKDIQESLEPLLKTESPGNKDRFQWLLSKDVIVKSPRIFSDIIDAKNNAEFDALLTLAHWTFFKDARFSITLNDPRGFKTKESESVDKESVDRSLNMAKYSPFSYVLVHGTVEMLTALMEHLRKPRTLGHYNNSTTSPIGGIANPISLMLHYTVEQDEIIRRCEVLLHNPPLTIGNPEVRRQLVTCDLESWQYLRSPLLLALDRDKDEKGLMKLRRPELARYLIRQGGLKALTQQVGRWGTAIDLILRSDQADLLDSILQKDLKVLMRKFECSGKETLTLFQYAIICHSTKCMKYLLEIKGLVNDVNTKVPVEWGEITALMAAAEKGDLELVRSLLLRRANPNIQGKDFRGKDGYGPTALFMAITKVKEVTVTLQRKKEQCGVGAGVTGMMLQEERDRRVDVVMELLTREADPNQGVGLTKQMLEGPENPLRKHANAENCKLSPLYVAVCFDTHDLIEPLIEAGAKLDPETDPKELRPLDIALAIYSQGKGKALEMLVRACKDPHALRLYPGGIESSSLAMLGFSCCPEIVGWLCAAGTFDSDQTAELGSVRSFRSYLDDTDDAQVGQEMIIQRQRDENGQIVENKKIPIVQDVLAESKKTLERYELALKQQQSLKIAAHGAPVSLITERLISPITKSVLQAVESNGVMCEQEASEAAAEASHKPPIVETTGDRRGEGLASQISDVGVEELDAQAVIIQQKQLTAARKVARQLKPNCQQQDHLLKGVFSKKSARYKKKTKAQADVKNSVSADVVSPEHALHQVPILKPANEPVLSSGALSASILEAKLDPSSLDEVPSCVLFSRRTESSEYAVGSRRRKQKKSLPALKSTGARSSDATGRAQDLAIQFWMSPSAGQVNRINSSLRSNPQYKTALEKLHMITSILRRLERWEPPEQRLCIETTLRLAALKYILEWSNFIAKLERNGICDRILSGSGVLEQIKDFRCCLLERCASGAVFEAGPILRAVQQFIIACDKDDRDRTAYSNTVVHQFWTDLCTPLLLLLECWQQREEANLEQQRSSQGLNCLNAFYALREVRQRVDGDNSLLKLIPAASSFLLIQMYHILFASYGANITDKDTWNRWTDWQGNLASHGPSDDQRSGSVSDCTLDLLLEMTQLLQQQFSSVERNRSLKGPSSISSQQKFLHFSPGSLGPFISLEPEVMSQDSALEQLQPSSTGPGPIGSGRPKPLGLFSVAPPQETSKTVVPDQEQEESFHVRFPSA